MKVHFYQIYFKEREEQYEENLVEYFLSTIFMANVVAMAGTGDDYNIETRNDNGVEVYSVLENDECNRDEAMAEILRLTGDPSYTQQPSLFRASDPLYQNNQGYHGTTTAYVSKLKAILPHKEARAMSIRKRSIVGIPTSNSRS